MNTIINFAKIKLIIYINTTVYFLKKNNQVFFQHFMKTISYISMRYRVEYFKIHSCKIQSLNTRLFRIFNQRLSRD